MFILRREALLQHTSQHCIVMLSTSKQILSTTGTIASCHKLVDLHDPISLLWFVVSFRGTDGASNIESLLKSEVECFKV